MPFISLVIVSYYKNERDEKMDLFKGMSKFGLQHLENVDIIEKPVVNDEKTEDTPKLTDIIYDKKMKCPVCNQAFSTKVIKVGKNQLLKTDEDLKAYYSIVDPILYDVVHCKCGYTAMSKSFGTILPVQRTLIKTNISQTFKPILEEFPRTIEYAIDLYKLALLNCVVKKGKNMEKGLICLRLAWLYRDLQDVENEKVYLNNAYQCFNEGVNTERLPIFDIDFHRASYLIAVLAYKCGDYNNALRVLSTLMLDQSVNAKLRIRLEDLKPKIIAQIKKNKIG